MLHWRRGTGSQSTPLGRAATSPATRVTDLLPIRASRTMSRPEVKQARSTASPAGEPGSMDKLSDCLLSIDSELQSSPSSATSSRCRYKHPRDMSERSLSSLASSWISCVGPALSALDSNHRDRSLRQTLFSVSCGQASVNLLPQPRSRDSARSFRESRVVSVTRVRQSRCVVSVAELLRIQLDKRNTAMLRERVNSVARPRRCRSVASKGLFVLR